MNKMPILPLYKIQVEQDIERCEGQKSICGSADLYSELVKRYRGRIDNFMNNLPAFGKEPEFGCGPDYRTELQLIASKLRTYLLAREREEAAEMNNNPMKKKVNEFIQRGIDIGKIEYHPSGRSGYVAGPLYDAWMGEIHIFNQRYLKKHPLYDSIANTYFRYGRNAICYNEMMGHLRALVTDTDFFEENSSQPQNKEEKSIMSNKVFIVHGHDDAAKQEMARTLEKAGFEAIILHEQPDMGRTIIEKFEDYSDVGFAVILYTECDLGRAKEMPADSEKHRARQNVVFEHGFFVGKLGRNHVCALVKGDVEVPGDLSGVVYVPMDNAGAWKMNLAKNMRAAGLPVDMNKFI